VTFGSSIGQPLWGVGAVDGTARIALLIVVVLLVAIVAAVAALAIVMRRRTARPAAAEPEESQPAPSGIVVYGTSWCAVCKDARAWLDARGVAYTARDVELDPAAAIAVADTLDELGVAADRIPVIDVAGRVLVGFDPTRLATILGEPI